MRDALAYWRQKINLTSEIFYALAEKYRAWTFTVFGLVKLEQIMTVRKSIEKALTEGLSFEEWLQNVDTLFRDAGWTGNSFFRLDNIYRTNIQSATTSADGSRRRRRAGTDHSACIAPSWTTGSGPLTRRRTERSTRWTTPTGTPGGRPTAATAGAPCAR
jgi:hypothetical protein